MRIYLSPPHMEGKELEYVQQAFASNYIAPAGEFLERFEASIKAYTKASHALALCSATAGIHLALRLLGVKEGEKVAVSSFTFIASASPILYQKATPVFIDCDESWQIDLELLEEAFKKERPKAAIVAHSYGGCADMEELDFLCQKYGVHLIEDAAESLGTTFNQRHTGTFGVFGVYSFNGNKLLTTGGGGVLGGRDPKLMEQAAKLATQAKEPGYPWYEHHTYGYNYRLSNILAAIGTAQMELVEERIAQKRRIFAQYEKLLGDIATFMPEHPKSRSNRWLTTLAFHTLSPRAVHQKLARAGIESRLLWKPLHAQPPFANAPRYDKGRGQRLFERGVALPSGTTLTDEEIGQICRAIRS